VGALGGRRTVRPERPVIVFHPRCLAQPYVSGTEALCDGRVSLRCVPASTGFLSAAPSILCGVPEKITTLTFDLWNTLYSASNGAGDAARSRRLELLAEILASRGTRTSDDEIRRAYRAGFDAYMAAWTGGSHFGAREDVAFVLDYFAARKARTPAEHEEFERIVLALEDASYLAPPVLVAGVHETIPALALSGHRLGIISDTSLTPGRVLRDFLKNDGLLDCFSTLTFSDETGFPKPDPRMFEVTLTGLGARPAEAAHVGDTPRTDIAGARAAGMIAIRCAGAVDQEGPPEADFVIRDHREIPGILEQLAGSDRSVDEETA
jgi:HAD superfamily hydrolase (TIGR01549 family)